MVIASRGLRYRLVAGDTRPPILLVKEFHSGLTAALNVILEMNVFNSVACMIAYFTLDNFVISKPSLISLF